MFRVLVSASRRNELFLNFTPLRVLSLEKKFATVRTGSPTRERRALPRALAITSSVQNPLLACESSLTFLILWRHIQLNTRIQKRWWRPISWRNISMTRESGSSSRMKIFYFTTPGIFLAQCISIGAPISRIR